MISCRRFAPRFGRLGLLFQIVFAGTGLLPAADSPANRLVSLDSTDPFYPDANTPRLITPQWVGEPGVEAVVILAIDDMRDSKRYETFLRPVLDRLKQIDGRAPLSIMTCVAQPEDPQLQKWLKEGLSIEVHTLAHPCPLLQKGNFAAAEQTVFGCLDLLDRIPGNQAAAFRMPCCDSMNSASPRFFAEIFNRVSPGGNFLAISSSVMNIFTSDDPALPRKSVLDSKGAERFRRYFPAQTNAMGQKNLGQFAGTIENYPYPYVVGKLCWEFPASAPSDWEAFNVQGATNALLLADWEAALDATVAKQGVFSFIFHPYGWSAPQQFVDFISYASAKYGSRIKFLNFHEAAERLNKNLLHGQPLRAANGLDNGVRLLDLNNDGFLDVVIGNENARATRVWDPARGIWNDTAFPAQISAAQKETGLRFGVIQPNGFASALVRGDLATNAWNFDGRGWVEDKTLLRGLLVNGRPVLTGAEGRDRGVRLRDVNNDGRCELIVGNESENAIFQWSPEEKSWKEAGYSLPKGASIVDAQGRDAGLRFVDLNGDGFDDIVFSNEKAYGVYAFVPVASRGVDWRVGWTQIMREGLRGDGGEIPMIVRGGRRPDNGAWFKKGALWVQNEETDTQPFVAQKLSYAQLLSIPGPPPKSPQDSLASIHVEPGFKAELVASEPLVKSPNWIDWDARGRMWVVEMADYPLGLDNKGKPGGRVKILEDTDGDGIYDKAALVIDGIHFPNSLAPWRGGVLLAAAPDILYVEPPGPDGSPGKRETFFTGFRVGNPQHLENGFCYGLDGWFYGANGDSGGTVTSVKTGRKVNISGHDFRFRPDTGEFETQPGGSQYGRWRDDWGNWFGNNNSVWAWHYFIQERYLARNPNLAVRTIRQATADYPGSTRIYPASPYARRFNWPDAVNTLTSGCNAMPYRDDLFGPAYAASLFICEPANNLVHREILEPDGVTFKSHRAQEDARGEFFASGDNWSRPTMARTGPDGALYIPDMYRLVLEHPEWIPAEMTKRLDLRAGENMGRIYRVSPVGAKLRRAPNLAARTTAELAASLQSAHGWERDTAQRLLLERADPSATRPLERLASASSRPVTRLQALWTLHDSGALAPALVQKALGDKHPAVREAAVRFCEDLPASAAARPPALSELETALLKLTRDPDVRVRFQLALTLGELGDARAGEALAALAARDSQNDQMRIAVLSSAPRHAEVMLQTLLAGPPPPPSAVVEQLLPLILDQPASLARAVSIIAAPRQGRFEDWQFDAVGGLLDVLARRATSLARFSAAADPALQAFLRQLDPLFAQARAASDAAGGNLSAIRLLGRGPSAGPEDLERLGGLLRPRFSPAVQQAALAELGKTSGEATGRILAGGWKTYSPSLRNEVANLLMGRPDWIQTLLDAVERGGVPANQISPAQRQRLVGHPNAAIRARAARSFGATNADRAKVVKSYDVVNDLAGEPARGAVVFKQICGACHRLRGEGNEVGPDLGSVADKSVPYLLEAVFDPNRAVESRYLAYSVVTKSDREISGVLTAETPNSITLKQPGGAEETILRSDLKEMTGSGLSLMPEGLESALKPADAADIIAYIKGAGGGKAKR
jgi:putative membrane-bound dehydrogenase-like protein